jgi:putative tricarboxylic transport membrane protein
VPGVRTEIKSAVGIGASVANFLLIPLVGFLIANSLYMTCLIWLLGYRHRIMTPLVAMAITGLIYAVFYFGLNVPLPEGELLDWSF